MPSGVYVSRAVKWELLGRVCLGASVAAAAAAMGVSRSAAWLWWREAGGMTLDKGRNGGVAGWVDQNGPGGTGHRLNLAERIEIMIGCLEGLSKAAIGAKIGRDRSVISREVARNCNPDDKLKQVSHETIYRCLYVQTRGRLRADLHKCLSTKRGARKSRGQVEGRRGVYSGEEFKISNRPAEADDRAVPGHWEGDLIMGAGNTSAVGTLVERTTRFTILLHLPIDHTADSVAEAMIAVMAQLPEHLRRTITWDRGSEMANWADIKMKLQAPVYFCDPYSPWQRGTNENTNRLLRHWFEKGTDLSGYTQADLTRIQDKLNTRPRPTLDLDTPAQRLAALINQAA